MYTDLKSFFEDIASSYKDRPALHYTDKAYSYETLNRHANQLVHYMLGIGIQAGDVIGIASSKSFADYAVMIACLKIGAAYTSLDIDNPLDRVANILYVCQPKLIFADQQYNKIRAASQTKSIAYKIYNEIELSEYEHTNPEIDVSPDSIAYIMFTSGSTGIPKGVAIKHESVTNFIRWSVSRYEITPDDNFANVSPMYFDNSVFDFYSALFTGAALTPLSKDLLTDPLNLMDYIDQKVCTIWFSVPSMLIYLMTMRVMTENCFKSIRIITFGGEGFPKTELKKLYDLYSDRAQIINVYGPTEGTCICSSYTVTEADFDDMSELPSLGPINQDFGYAIMDDGVPAITGELWITGPNIALGYYNDPERTAQAFGEYEAQPMYKTGDLVEENNSLLYFKGRADNQIKHMGYRIELEEIEFALNSLDEVLQSAVIYKRDKAAYGKIVAFLVLEAANAEVSIDKVKHAMHDKLPEYMIPNIFKVLDSFPKNQNGKIDKTQLKEMDI